jgi:hypothetical protein
MTDGAAAAAVAKPPVPPKRAGILHFDVIRTPVDYQGMLGQFYPLDILNLPLFFIYYFIVLLLCCSIFELSNYH